MIARLADTLGLPLREQNALLVAAGYAPRYPETALCTPALAPVRRAIELILEQHITTFGTPRDVTLDEIRIECWFPGDDATAEVCRALAGPSVSGTSRSPPAPSA